MEPRADTVTMDECRVPLLSAYLRNDQYLRGVRMTRKRTGRALTYLPPSAGIAFLLAVGAITEPVHGQYVSETLGSIAEGSDPAFGSAVAPAASPDPTKSQRDRIADTLDRIGTEVESVARAFETAEGEKKIPAARTAAAAFSRETAREGAARDFEGNGPTVSVTRQLIFVPTSGSDAAGTERVMNIVSSFERSPKTEDSYFTYSNPLDLRKSSVTELAGSDTSWTSGAQLPMEMGKLYSLKKCRSIPILGWYCNTARYQVRDISGFAKATQLLIAFLVPLPKDADNGLFDDERAENVVDGYTGVYLVTTRNGVTLVYNLGIQSSSRPPRLNSLLKAEHRDEYRQLVDRIQSVMGSPGAPR